MILEIKKRAQNHYCKIHAKLRPLLIKNRAKLQPCKIHAKALARSQNSTVFAQLLFQLPPAAVSLAAGRRTHFQKKREEGRFPGPPRFLVLGAAEEYFVASVNPPSFRVLL